MSDGGFLVDSEQQRDWQSHENDFWSHLFFLIIRLVLFIIGSLEGKGNYGEENKITCSLLVPALFTSWHVSFQPLIGADE